MLWCGLCKRCSRPAQHGHHPRKPCDSLSLSCLNKLQHNASVCGAWLHLTTAAEALHLPNPTSSSFFLLPVANAMVLGVLLYAMAITDAARREAELPAALRRNTAVRQVKRPMQARDAFTNMRGL